VSGPVRPPLTVEESDGSVVVRPANDIKFNAADFTVAKSGQTATISIDSTGTGAALTDTHIGFGNASNLLTGSADFTFTADTGSAGPIVLLTGNKPIWRLQDDTDATDYKSSWEQSGNSLYLYNGDSAGNNYEIHRISPAYIHWNRGNADFDFYFDTSSTEKFFTIDSGNDTVGIGGAPGSGTRLHVQGDGSKTSTVRIQTDDDDAAVGPVVELFKNSASPDTGDDIGQILFTANDSAGAKQKYFQIKGEIRDKTSGSDDGELIFIGPSNSTDIEFVRMSKTVGVVVNEGGGGIVDFRVEGTTNDNLIRTYAGQDNVGIGTAPPSGHTGVVPMLTVEGADDAIALLLVNEGTDADDGPLMVMFRDSSSPAVNDLLGRIRFDGEDTGGNPHTYFRMTNAIKDPTDGAEYGRFTFENRANGQLYEVLRFEGASVVFNNSDNEFVDVKILGNNDTILFSDASQDNLGVGTSSPSSGVERLHIKGSGSSTLVKMESTDAGATAAPDLVLYRNTATPAVNDVIGALQFTTNGSGGAEYTAAQIQSKISDTTAGSENAKLQFYGRDQGYSVLVFEIDGSGNLIVNPDSSAYRDFKVNSDNVTAFQVSAGQDNVGMGGAPDSAVERLNVKGTGGGTLVRFESTNTDNQPGPNVELSRFPSDGVSSTADDLGMLIFKGLQYDGTGSNTDPANFTEESFADMYAEIGNYQGDGRIVHRVRQNGGMTEYLRVDGNTQEITFNDGSGNDFDFRVEGAANANLLYIDGSQDNIGISAAPSAAGATLQVDLDASFLRPVNTTQHASNHDVTVLEAHGYVLIGKTTSGTCNFNLPDAVAGMHLRIINIGSGINVVTATGDSLNGVTNSGTTATLAASITGTGSALDLVCIADNTWICNNMAAPTAT
jgi:hypothetical protein